MKFKVKSQSKKILGVILLRKIEIFDTTLRDGEQAPGATMTIQEKVELAKILEDLNVDVIEAGFPIASKGDFKAVKEISETLKKSTVTALARATNKDIEIAAKALKDAVNPRIHTFIATSPIHREFKLRLSKEEIVKKAVKAVKLAKSYVEDVEFSAEDAGRTELPFLYEIFEKVIDAGATVINVPDTVGYKTPKEFGEFIKSIKENVPNIKKAKVSVHCHNDLGLAVANSLAAIDNGADQVECTLNGIGERAGNASMEEIVMILATRKDLYKDIYTDIKTEKIYNASKKVELVSGFDIAKNKPIVGKNVFLHESGIHQDGVLKERTTYEIMSPESIGRNVDNIVLGKHSGRHAFEVKLKKLGYNLVKEEFERMYQKFLDVCDNLKEVNEEDIRAIIEGERSTVEKIYALDYVSVTSGSMYPNAVIRLTKDEKEYMETSTGDGPVDAAYKAIDKIINSGCTLIDYKIKATSEKKETLGEARVKIKGNKYNFLGIGTSTDIIEASIKAYLNAINKMLVVENAERGEKDEV
ncbi:MAG: 2-isopropylmalate synthase [Fusobacteriota bacterium]